jgi:hypothetical protein
VHADFGAFEGTVERAAPEGLSGLRMAAYTQTSEPTLDLLTWERIDHIERGENRALTGAIGGAIGFGVLGALIGLAGTVATGAAGTGEDNGSWIGIGFACGAAGGALLGAAAGSARTNWRPVYKR